MKPSCLPCKRRHVKCDQRRPICTRCAKAKTKIKCSYPVKFRQSGLSIGDPSHGLLLRFVNESPGRNSDTLPDRSPSTNTPPGRHLSHLDTSGERSMSPSDPPAPPVNSQNSQSDCNVPPPVSETLLPRPLQCQPLSPCSHEESPAEPQRSDISADKQPSTPLAAPLSAAANSQRIRITSSEHDLFQFYLEHAGVWLDIVSSDRSFSQTVPSLALHKPALYYACLAYAAHVLSLWGSCDRARADYLHNEVITRLIPKLDLNSQLLPEDDLLATIVILRMSEQYSEPEQDTQCHLNGAYSLLTSTKFKWSPGDIDLKGTVFWTFVRQTLRLCFLSEQECGFDLSIVNSNNMTSPAPEQVWTNRMTYLSAQVCNACWWSPLLDDASRDCLLDAVEKGVDSWRDSVPETFKPWYYHQSLSDSFPTIRYLSSWHGKSIYRPYFKSNSLLTATTAQ
ncbi:uncharacterized protein N7446_000748 [Penicillium canescens]|uniref:Zn(2)-C6 fungal-type domain-containing protein n=1 Tax=Penicillium canescens TaxID=5083 RepID=A0AAD6N4R9_PENCN|nr:uncharacterized protein N7446_000748 [Penicillium canescens]KAJ6030191.1 hypothetical protein N7460_010457 [Penicillium canescens]KAJ6060568.1 hypothetical protein N7444_002422 [Penicillium canescens]KAJ6077812.1 hypothetical protein N7446_000748 [Penicillium canescens]